MGSIKTDFEVKLFQRRSSHGRRGKHQSASPRASNLMMMRSSDPGLNVPSWGHDTVEDDDEDDPNTIRVLISGFGPFRDHVVNASWEAVKLINPDDIISLLRNSDASNCEDILANSPTIKISFCYIEVVYNTVHQVIPTLWEKYKPHLTIHVGVSGIAKAITLEQFAHNCGYCSPDIKECLPDKNQCVEGGCEVLESGLNMAKAMKRINAIVAVYSGSKNVGVDSPVIPRTVHADVSHDPGRFLCDFIYYRSLSVDKERTAFIHVPPLGKPYSASELAMGISMCISEFIQQLDERKLLLQ